MQPEQILSADLLDILFADRNKSYGAYPLRRGYNKRLTTALFCTGMFVSLVLSFFYFSAKAEVPIHDSIVGRTLFLEEIKEPEPLAPPPPPQPPPPRQVRMVRNFIPVIVQDDRADAPPPTTEDLDRSLIGPINQDGLDAPDIVAPPIEADGKGIIEAPKRVDESEKEFVPVEIESTYPGGMAAWKRFLLKTINYPDEARDNEIKGPVTVKFEVDKDGKVSDIVAISGPEELRNEAVRVISKSGKWTPAVQNGHYVKSIKHQQIIFALQTE